MAKEGRGRMTDSLANGGCARYVIGIAATAFYTPLIIGIGLAIFSGEVLAVPVILLYGVIVTIPFAIVGSIVYAVIDRFTAVLWWHAVLVGSGIILCAALFLSGFKLPSSSDDYWILAIFLTIGSFGALIFHHCVRPNKSSPTAAEKCRTES